MFIELACQVASGDTGHWHRKAGTEAGAGEKAGLGYRRRRGSQLKLEPEDETGERHQAQEARKC
jgi:hypothetical protein